ncbi:MAG TPA: hypothetical protein VLG25_02425 [Patescibacteria group bacterium]|nr:hypothetical protein [Patescibacteria group bacterium]
MPVSTQEMGFGSRQVTEAQPQVEHSAERHEGALKHIVEELGHVAGGVLHVVGEVVSPQLHHEGSSEHTYKGQKHPRLPGLVDPRG